MEVLWQGNLEVCQDNISGVSYGEKIGVIIKKFEDEHKSRAVFDWDSGISTVRLGLCPKQCLKQPLKIQKYLRNSQMVNICKDADTPQEKWDSLENNLCKNTGKNDVKESGEAYVFHLVAEGSNDSEIYCPLVLMTFPEKGIGAAFCVDDTSKEITQIKEVFKVFNEKLYSNVNKYLEQDKQSNSKKQASVSQSKGTEADQSISISVSEGLPEPALPILDPETEPALPITTCSQLVPILESKPALPTTTCSQPVSILESEKQPSASQSKDTAAAEQFTPISFSEGLPNSIPVHETELALPTTTCSQPVPIRETEPALPTTTCSQPVPILESEPTLPTTTCNQIVPILESEKQPSASQSKDTVAAEQSTPISLSEGLPDSIPVLETEPALPMTKCSQLVPILETEPPLPTITCSQPVHIPETEPPSSTPTSTQSDMDMFQSVAPADETPSSEAVLSQPEYLDKPPESVVIIGEKSNILPSISIADVPPPSVQIVSQPDYLDIPPESVIIVGEKCANVQPSEITTTDTRNIVSPALSSCSANSNEERPSSSKSKVKLKNIKSMLKQVNLCKPAQSSGANQNASVAQQTHLQQGQNFVQQTNNMGQIPQTFNPTSTVQVQQAFNPASTMEIRQEFNPASTVQVQQAFNPANTIQVQQTFSNPRMGSHLNQQPCSITNSGYMAQQTSSNTNVQQSMQLRPQVQVQPQTITHPQGHVYQPPPTVRGTYIPQQPQLSNIRGQQTSAGFVRGQFQQQHNFQNPQNTIPSRPQQMPRMQNVPNAPFFSASSYHTLNVQPQFANTATTPGNPRMQQSRFRNPQPQMIGQNQQLINQQQMQFVRQRPPLQTWQHTSNPGMIRNMQPRVQNTSNPSMIRTMQPGIQNNSNPSMLRTMLPTVQTNIVKAMPTVAQLNPNVGTMHPRVQSNFNPGLTRTMQPSTENNYRLSTSKTSTGTISLMEAKSVSTEDWSSIKNFIEQILNANSNVSPEQKEYFNAWLQIMSSNPEDNLERVVPSQNITSDLTKFAIWSVIVGRETVDNFFEWLKDSGFSEERVVLKNVIQHLQTQYIAKNTYVHNPTKGRKGGPEVSADAISRDLEELVVEPIIMWDYKEDRALACVQKIKGWLVINVAKLQSSFLDLLRGKYGIQAFVTLNDIPSVEVEILKKIFPHLRYGIIHEKIQLIDISPDFGKYKIVQQAHMAQPCDVSKAREFLLRLKLFIQQKGVEIEYKIGELFKKNNTKIEYEMLGNHRNALPDVLHKISNLECAVYNGFITNVELKDSLEFDDGIADKVKNCLTVIIKRMMAEENVDTNVARDKTVQIVKALINRQISIEECHLQLNANEQEKCILTEENISRFANKATTKGSKAAAPAVVSQSATPSFVAPSPVPPSSPSPLAQSTSPSPLVQTPLPSPGAPKAVASSPSSMMPPPSPENGILSPSSGSSRVSASSEVGTVVSMTSSSVPVISPVTKKLLSSTEKWDKAEENLKLYLYKCFSKKGSKEMEKIGDIFVDLLNQKKTVDQFVNEAKLTEQHMKDLFLKQMKENFSSFLHAVLIGKLKLEELHWVFKETYVVKIPSTSETKVFNPSRAKRFLGYLKKNLSSQESGLNQKELAIIENSFQRLRDKNINTEQLFSLSVWDKVRPELRGDLQTKTELDLEHLRIGLPTVSKKDFHSYFIKEAESVPADLNNTASSANDAVPGPAVSPPPSDLSNIQLLGPCTPAPHRSVSPAGGGGLRVLNPSQLNSRVSEASLTAENTFSVPATLDYKLHAHLYISVPQAHTRQYVVIFCNNFLVFCHNKIQLPQTLEQNHKFEIERWRNDLNEEQGKILLPLGKTFHHFVYICSYSRFEQNFLNAQNNQESICIIKIAKFEQFYLEFEIKHNMELGINVDRNSIFPSQTKNENPLLSMLKNISGVERNLSYRRQLTGHFNVSFAEVRKYVCLIFNTHLVYIPDYPHPTGVRQMYTTVIKYFLERVPFGSSIKSRYCCIVGLDFLKIMTNEALLHAEIVTADKINRLIEKYAPFSVVRGDSFKSILPHSYPFTNIGPQAGIPAVERKVVCLATVCLNLKGFKQSAILGYFQPFEKHENEEVIYVKMSKEEMSVREMDMFIIIREKFRNPIEQNYSRSSDWSTVKLELVPGQGMYRLVISPLGRAAGNHPMMRFMSLKMKGALLNALENQEDVYSSRACLDKLFKDRSKKLITNWKPLCGDKSYSDFHQVNKALISSDMDTSLDSPPTPATDLSSSLPCQSPESSSQGLSAEARGTDEAGSVIRSTSRESVRPSIIGGRGQHSKRFPLSKLRDQDSSAHKSVEDCAGDITDIQNIEDIGCVSQGNFSAVSSFISSSSQEFPVDFLSGVDLQRKKNPVDVSHGRNSEIWSNEDNRKIIDLANAPLEDLLIIPGIDNETGKTIIQERNGRQTLSDFVQSEDAFIALLEDIQYDVGDVKSGDIVIKYRNSIVNESLLKPLERFREWKEIVMDASEIKILDVVDCESLAHYIEMNKSDTENVNGLLSALKQNVRDMENVPVNIAKMVIAFMDKAGSEKIVLTVDGRGLTPQFWKEQGHKIPQWMEFAARYLEVKASTFNDKFSEALHCPDTFGKSMYPDVTVEQRCQTLHCRQCNRIADCFVIFRKTCLDTNHTQLDMDGKQTIVCEENLKEGGCSKAFDNIASYMIHRDEDHGFPDNLAAVCSLCTNKFQYPKDLLEHGCEISLNSKIEFSKQIEEDARPSEIETTQETSVPDTQTDTTQDDDDGDTNEFSLASMINQTKERTLSKPICEGKQEESIAMKDTPTDSELVQPLKDPDDSTVLEIDKSAVSESANKSIGIKEAKDATTEVSQQRTTQIETINEETGLPTEFDVHRVTDDRESLSYHPEEIETGKSAPTMSNVWTEIPRDIWEEVANTETPIKRMESEDATASPSVEASLQSEICIAQVNTSKVIVSNEDTTTASQVQSWGQKRSNVDRSSESQYIIPDSNSDEAELVYSSSDVDPEDRPRKAVKKTKKLPSTKSSAVKQPVSAKDKWMSSFSKGPASNDGHHVKTVGTWGTVRRKSMSEKVTDKEKLGQGDAWPDNSTESIYNMLRDIPQVEDSRKENKQPERCGSCIGCIRNKNKNSCMECFYCKTLADSARCKKRRCLKIAPSVAAVRNDTGSKTLNPSISKVKRKRKRRPMLESGSSSDIEDNDDDGDYEDDVEDEHVESRGRSQPPHRLTSALILTNFEDKLYKPQAVVLNKLSTNTLKKYIPYYGEEESNNMLDISKKIDEIELVPYPIHTAHYTDRDIWDATFARLEKRPVIKRKKVFTCNLCLAEFSDVNLKIAHINQVHTETFEDIYERKKKQPRTFECNLCKQKFPSRDKKDNHIMETHVDPEDQGPPKKVIRKAFDGPETVEVTVSLQFDGEGTVSDSSQNTLNAPGGGDCGAKSDTSLLRRKDGHVTSLTQSDGSNTEILSIFPVKENVRTNCDTQASQVKSTEDTEALTIFKVSGGIKTKNENVSNFKESEGNMLPKNPANVFSCVTCGETFPSLTGLIDHGSSAKHSVFTKKRRPTQTVHQSDEYEMDALFECEECHPPRVFDKEGSLKHTEHHKSKINELKVNTGLYRDLKSKGMLRINLTDLAYIKHRDGLKVGREIREQILQDESLVSASKSKLLECKVPGCEFIPADCATLLKHIKKVHLKELSLNRP